MQTENGAYLAHHGVIGMKWGVRRYQKKDGTLTKLGRAHRKQDDQGEAEGQEKEKKSSAKEAAAKAKETASKAKDFIEKTAKKAVEAKSKNPGKHLSDDELKTRINRMNQEAQYKRLKNELNPKSQHKVFKSLVSTPFSKIVAIPVMAALATVVREETLKKTRAFVAKKAAQQTTNIIT